MGSRRLYSSVPLSMTRYLGVGYMKRRVRLSNVPPMKVMSAVVISGFFFGFFSFGFMGCFGFVCCFGLSTVCVLAWRWRFLFHVRSLCAKAGRRVLCSFVRIVVLFRTCLPRCRMIR